MLTRCQKLQIATVMAVWLVLFIGTSAFGAMDNATLERLERLIKQQQAQIEAQAEAIKQLKQQVSSLSRQVEQKSDMKPAAAKEQKTVTSASDKVSVQLYGQVNRGVLYAHDGNEDYFYHVDNDNSSTRIGILGKSKLNSDITAGTKIEVEFQANASNEVTQVNRNGVGSNNFKKRHLDLFFHSQKFGKLSLGWGDTASNGTSEVDLSGTAVIGTSDIPDMAGGQYFYKTGTLLTDNPQVKSVSTNMDGLGRDDRIRYDTPSFYGFGVAVSNVSGDANDIALRYGAKLGSVKLAAAVAYADPGSTSSSTDNQFNGSISALHDSGINLTFAAGRRELIAQGRDDSKFYYGKLGYQAGLFKTGKTKFAVDYGRSEDIAANDDQFDSFGAMAVQDLKDWGSEFYLGYRYHQLESGALNYDNINAVLSGFRVKF